jgi:hypothetical protein
MRFPQLLCATAGLLTLSAGAFAQSITFSTDVGWGGASVVYTDASGTHTAGGWAGTLVASGSAVTSPFDVYCVDLEDEVSNPQTVTVTPVTVPLTPPQTATGKYDATNVTGAGVGTFGQLEYAGWLIGNNVVLPTSSVASATAADQAAAIQFAIWDVIYGNFSTSSDVSVAGLTNHSASFYITNLNSPDINSVLSDVSTLLQGLQAAISNPTLANGGGLGPGTLLQVNRPGAGQDTFGGPGITTHIAATPEGASLLLFLPGLIPVAVGLRQRRRNKSAK